MTAPDPRLEEIESRLSKATPGPWEVDRNYPFTDDLVGIFAKDAQKYVVQVENQDDVDDPTSDADAEFIAAAPADVAYLLAELRKAQDKLARVEGLADEWEARGEHDMKFSKAFGDEDIAMTLLTGGAAMVENARHIRNAIRAAVADATGGERG